MISSGTRKLRLSLKVSLAFLIFLIFSMQSLLSQTNRLDHILAQNFEARGQVLELSTPSNWKTKPILIGWQTQSGQQFSEQVLLTTGKNIIIPKQGWTQPISMLATNVQGLQIRIRPSNFATKFLAFLKPNPITPGSINFDLGYRFGNTSLSLILFGLFCISAILFFLLNQKSVTVAISLGLVVAFFCLNLRQIKNQVDVIQNFNDNQKQIPPFESLEDFFDNCQATIGPSSWTIEKLPGVWNSYAKYSLAANEYKPNSIPQNSGATYLITNNTTRNQNVVIQSNGVKLIKLNQ